MLLDSLESDRARTRALAADVIDGADRDRAALAHELHDSTAQEIVALLMQLSAAARDAADPRLAQRLNDARDAAERLLEEVRALSYKVHPGVRDNLGLEAALRRLAHESSRDTGTQIDVTVDSTLARLPSRLETVLYRVGEEAITNALRHAAPRTIQVTLHRDPTSARLDVHDDGRGFDLAAADRRHSGMGFRSMRDRVALVDGRVDVNTALGGGTTVSAIIPLDVASNHVH
jgi:signal transduction histidine kinase